MKVQCKYVVFCVGPYHENVVNENLWRMHKTSVSNLAGID